MTDISNDLQVKFYDGPTSTTELPNVGGVFDAARVDSFGTAFPAGLYTTARILLPISIKRTRLVRENQRVALYNGLELVWEGVTSAIPLAATADEQTVVAECVGQWGPQIRSQTINKRWADNRLSEDMWVRQPQGDKDNQANVDRMNRISVGPNTVAWTTLEIVAAFRYTMPTGETIKRIVATLKNRESGQNWITRVEDVIGSSTLFSEAGDGITTAFDTTLATPRQYAEFQFISNANQTPGAAVYGRMTNVMVYSETGSINPTEIIKDIRALLAGLNSDEQYIGSNTLTLEPFITNGEESVETLLQRVAGYGDTSYNPWAVYLGPSVLAAAPDGKPVLVFAAYPTLTAWDYSVSLDELEGSIEFRRQVDGHVYNWIAVRYTDENGYQQVITPDDYATLKDQTSIDLWGERHTTVDCDTASAATALNFGRRVLSWRKDAKYVASAPLQIRGSVKTYAGVRVPACRIRSGQRIRITNILQDEVGVDGAGLTFLITGTTFRYATVTNEVLTGAPDNLAVFLARQALASGRQVM